jgi:diguanylate cyclase (GGDEF)-like protein
MWLDTRTMLLANGLAMIIFAVGLGIANLRDAKMRSMTMWSAGLLALCASTALYGFRDAMPLALSVIAGFVCLNAGFLLEYAALRTFRGRPVRWRALCAVTAAAITAHIVLLLTGASEQLRIAFASAVMAAWLVASLLVLLRGIKADERYSHVLTASFFGVWACCSLLRGLYAAFSGDPHMTLFATNVVQSVWLAIQFVSILGTSLGFILMTKERSDHEIIRLASTDSLTGLLNRRTFMESAYAELARAHREHRPTCVLMLDLDHFKKINDTYGHRAGDRVLQHFSQALRSCIRPFDLAGRYGGEEFCVLLSGAEPAEAEAIADRIRAAVEADVVDVATANLAYTVSIGVTDVPRDAVVLEEIVSRADEALYEAKSGGRNRVVARLNREAVVR